MFSQQINLTGRTTLIVLLCFSLLSSLFAGQEFPRNSQKSSITQRIGITDMTIVYHSPAVNGREVWGKLVPYDAVWRAGANDNTTISFTHDVKINGKNLAAGTYGLHMIPGEYDWTLAFSTKNDAWGSFTYKEEEDALRIQTVPQKAEFREWLSYDISDRSANKITASLRWEKLQVPFTVEVNVDDVVLNDIRSNTAKMTWQELAQSANYAADNTTHYDEALAWVDKSINTEQKFQNMQVKAKVLGKMGNESAAEKAMGTAAGLADEEWMLNSYGYQLLGAGKADKAIEVFKLNVEKFPASWNVYDSLAEAHAAKGDTKAAKKNYEKAMSMVPADDPLGNKTRIKNVLATL